MVAADGRAPAPAGETTGAARVLRMAAEGELLGKAKRETDRQRARVHLRARVREALARRRPALPVG